MLVELDEHGYVEPSARTLVDGTVPDGSYGLRVG